MAVSNFKGYDNIGEPSLSEAIEDNIVEYINWGFLKLGAYYNIRIPTSGNFGGNMHQLRSINDPNYERGQVWGANRANWVWESGLATSEEPIAISGIFVDGDFLPKGSGYHINYKYGHVVFDEPIDNTSDVKLEYSSKWIDVVNSDSVDWLRQTQSMSYRVDDRLYVAGSGDWNVNRIQPPIVAVESVGKGYKGYQLGGGQYAYTDIILHVVTENSRTASRLASVLAEQNESDLYMYDPGLMADQNRFPLDSRGEIASGALCYPDLIAATGDGGFRYTNKVQHGKITVNNSRMQDITKLNNIYHCPVRWSTEVILHKI